MSGRNGRGNVQEQECGVPPPPGETASILWRLAPAPENRRHQNKYLFKQLRPFMSFSVSNVALFCFVFFNNKLVYMPNFKFLSLGHGVKRV